MKHGGNPGSSRGETRMGQVPAYELRMVTIEENFQFLIFETGKQLDAALANLEDPDPARFSVVQSRDDYIDQLKALIESRCYRQVQDAGGSARKLMDRLIAQNVITANLERIADYAVNLCKQALYLHNTRLPRQFNYFEMFSEVRAGIDGILPALKDLDVDLAMEICNRESTLDNRFKEYLDRITLRLQSGRQARDLLTMLFILRYLERMGDCLLNIGEAIISAAVGQRMKIHQMEALDSNLRAVGNQPRLDSLKLHDYRDTRSGCRITRVEGIETVHAARAAIFKEGRLAKIAREEANLRRWSELDPALVPRIFEYQPHEDKASLLVEYFTGNTLQALLLGGTEESGRLGVQEVLEVLPGIWERTLIQEPVAPRFLSQLKRRMGDVRRVHPGLGRHAQELCGVTVPSLGDLLGLLADVDRELHAPFSVWIHGDLNVDNLIYNTKRNSLHLIDLYRSEQQDYLQDISVFMVSMYRLPVKDPQRRREIAQRITSVRRAAEAFALAHDDHEWQARLCLGIARSCISSIRFVLDRRFARQLFLLGIYLMETMVDHDGPASSYRLPRDLFRA